LLTNNYLSTPVDGQSLLADFSAAYCPLVTVDGQTRCADLLADSSLPTIDEQTLLKESCLRVLP